MRPKFKVAETLFVKAKVYSAQEPIVIFDTILSAPYINDNLGFKPNSITPLSPLKKLFFVIEDSTWENTNGLKRISIKKSVNVCFVDIAKKNSSVNYHSNA